MNAPAPCAGLAAARPHAAIYVKLTLVALFWGGTFIAGRILAGSMSATGAATGRFAIAALLLTALTWPAAASMLYLGAIGTVVAFVWYSQGIRELGAARAAVFTNLVPVFGVLPSVALLGEPLSASMLVGGALVIAGVALTNRARH